MTAKTPEEVMKKAWIRTGDLRVLFECGENKATKIMKEIKLFQDSTSGMLVGVCHIDDYHAWIKLNREKNKRRIYDNDER